MESWVGPGNEANLFAYTMYMLFISRVELAHAYDLFAYDWVAEKSFSFYTFQQLCTPMDQDFVLWSHLNRTHSGTQPFSKEKLSTKVLLI